MNSYDVEVKPPARKELEALPDNVLSRVVRKLEALGHTPRPAGCQKLKGYKDQWRVRVGDWCGAKVAFGGLDGSVAEQELDLFELAPPPRQSFAQVLRRSCGPSLPASTKPRAFLSTIVQTARSSTPSPQTAPPLLMVRRSRPLEIPAAAIHSSIAIFTQAGTGTLRTRFPFPSRSTSPE